MKFLLLQGKKKKDSVKTEKELIKLRNWATRWRI